MKQLTFLKLGISIVMSLTFVACNSEEETVVPDMSPAAKAATTETAEPELQPIQALTPSSNSKTTIDVGDYTPGEDGSYTIQVGIQPSRKGANALIEKLESSGVDGAYIAQVENPGELEGTYYRIRVGFFKTLPQAQGFGKKALAPLGYAWWVDNRSNDAVGAPESDAGNSESSSDYESTPATSYYNNTPAPVEIAPVATEPKPVATESPSVPAETTTTSAPIQSAPVVEPAPTPAATETAPVETAPAPTAPAPAPAASDTGYDDWEM